MENAPTCDAIYKISDIHHLCINVENFHGEKLIYLYDKWQQTGVCQTPVNVADS